MKTCLWTTKPAGVKKPQSCPMPALPHESYCPLHLIMAKRMERRRDNSLVEKAKKVQSVILKEPSVTKAKLTEMFKNEECCGIWYDEEKIAHLPSGEEMGRCTNCAWYVVGKLGRGQVYGFTVEDMPGYNYHPIVIAGGHDFALIDERYIVDIWISLYAGEEKQIVFDRQDPADQAKIRQIYGNPQHWSLLKG